MPSPGTDRAPVTPVAAHAHRSVVALKQIAGKNWRNLRVLGALGVLIAGDVVFHGEARGSQGQRGCYVRVD
jgi:uncharacterized protein involved in response to NO